MGLKQEHFDEIIPGEFILFNLFLMRPKFVICPLNKEVLLISLLLKKFLKNCLNKLSKIIKKIIKKITLATKNTYID